MAVNTEIDVTKNLIIHHFSEKVSLPTLTTTIENTLADPKYRLGMDAIWICEDGTEIDMTSEDTQKISELARQSFDKEGISYKLALVASDDLAYGMTRVYEGWSNDREIKINTFRKLDEAFAWIEEE
jgi:hypothetical protein